MMNTLLLPKKFRLLLLALLLSSFSAFAQNQYHANGDVNLDGEVTIADVNEVIDAILTNNHNMAADVNGDGEITIADANDVIDLILSGSQARYYSTILVTTCDGSTTEYLIDENTRVKVEKPNLLIETDGKVLTYDLDHMARLRYGKRRVTSGLNGTGAPYQEEGIHNDGDDRPQYALYTYRNDGGFDAFLNIDVDSITYSNTDVNGVTYTNAVIQQVWTPDSLYRIPLAAIDSIAFRAPDPVFKDNVFHITESHIPYVKEVTENSVVFSPSIPDSMLPSLGQVMISDVYDVPFDEGFAGRVVDIYRKSTYIRITCADVTLDDVYDQIIAVGKTVVYNDDDLPQGAPRRIIHIYEDGTLSVSLGKVSLDLFTEKEIDQFTDQPTGNKDNYVKMSVTPELSMDYTICYRIKGVENKFKVIFNTNLDCDFDFKWPQTRKPVTWEKYCPTFIPIPTSIPALYSKICFGGYLDINGSVQLKADIPFTLHNRIGYDSDKEDYNGLVFDFEGTKFDTPVVTMSLNAEASVGLAIKYVTCIVAEKISSADIKLKAGPKASGSFEISSEGYSPDGWSWYDAMKDSKFSFQWVDASVSGGVKAFKWKKDLNYNLPIDELFPSLGKRTYYLFPDFAEPALRDRTDASGYSLTALTSDMSRDIIFSVTPGFGLYDQDNKLLYESFSTQKYRYEEDWDDTNLQMELKNYPPGTYTAVPIFKNSIFGTVKARPVAEVTIPEPVELEKTEVNLKKGETKTLSMRGGWGIYYLDNGDQGFAQASFVTDGHDGDWGQSWPPKGGTDYPNVTPSIKITGLDYGKATITLRDVRSSQVITLTVNVTDELSYIAPNEAIDLGLPSGTLWAPYNLGASSPEEFGGYYAWGETEVKDVYDSENYLYKDENGYIDIGRNICGTDYDAAHVKWGGDWRMPTMEELNELWNHCTHSWTAVNGINGMLLTAPNGNSVFLPAASCNWSDDNCWGFYRAGTCPSGYGNPLVPTEPNILQFTTYGLDDLGTYGSVYGLSIRPVREKPGTPIIAVNPTSINFGQVPVGQTRTQHFTVSNVGDGILTFSVSSTHGMFDIPESGQEFSLQPGGEKVFDVTFTPQSANMGGGPAVRVFSNAENGTQYIEIDGQGGPPSNDHEGDWVDLGLPSGTLWATCNVGANSPEEYGDYFAWGETEPKDYYDWSTYKWWNSTLLTKYCLESVYGYNGFTDGKTELDPEDDAAYVNWGHSWRMPTFNQQKELVQQCTWTRTTQNGVNGHKVTGPNGNAIFIPAAGDRSASSLNGVGSYGIYWSCTLDAGYYSFNLTFESSGNLGCWRRERYFGLPVRAVFMPPAELYIKQQNLDLGDVFIGAIRTREVTIVNNTMTDKTVTVTADAPFVFKEGENYVSRMTILVPGNSSSSVIVMFTATTLGDYKGNITFHNSAFEGGQCVIPIRAHAVAYVDVHQDDYVDLGLPSGTLWATMNVGAMTPEDFGKSFAWGETETKSRYWWESYKWSNDNGNTMTKYCPVDNKTELDPEDDAAYMNWGPSWRMPTRQQQIELIEQCRRTNTTINGVNGFLFTGPNGNTMFLPDNSIENYWSRTVRNWENYDEAYFLYNRVNNHFIRCVGMNVRAVRVP